MHLKTLLKPSKPVIGMVHPGALPGTPLHDGAAGIDGIVAAARTELCALQAAGFDAVMLGKIARLPVRLAAITGGVFPRIEVRSAAKKKYAQGMEDTNAQGT